MKYNYIIVTILLFLLIFSCKENENPLDIIEFNNKIVKATDGEGWITEFIYDTHNRLVKLNYYSNDDTDFSYGAYYDTLYYNNQDRIIKVKAVREGTYKGRKLEFNYSSNQIEIISYDVDECGYDDLDKYIWEINNNGEPVKTKWFNYYNNDWHQDISTHTLKWSDGLLVKEVYTYTEDGSDFRDCSNTGCDTITYIYNGIYNPFNNLSNNYLLGYIIEELAPTEIVSSYSFLLTTKELPVQITKKRWKYCNYEYTKINNNKYFFDDEGRIIEAEETTTYKNYDESTDNKVFSECFISKITYE